MARQQYNDNPNWKHRNIVPKNKGKFLQDIWKYHTDVQEQILRLSAVPIRVTTKSANIKGGQLTLKVDENFTIDSFKKEIASTFKISADDIDLENELFYADIANAQNISASTRETLRVRAEQNFLLSSFFPVIDGAMSMKGNALTFNLSDIETQIRESFPSIKIKKDSKNKILYFCQEYQDFEQGQKLRDIIDSEFSDICGDTLSFIIYKTPENKEKYIIEVDEKSKKEELSATIDKLKGKEFCTGDYTFGKLFRINYPNLTFDISGDNFEETKKKFESHTVSIIEPSITASLEKFNRLRKSINNILNGKDLQNPKLADFIFDAEKATKITDINLSIDSNSDIYRELNYHLLNKTINEPQKQALIKTLLAEDLALIQGPPGTGKSTAIAEMIWQHIRCNPKERILLTSETNLAVDNAIDRIVNKNHNLVKPIRIGSEDRLEDEGRQFSLDAMKNWVENGLETPAQKLILQNWIDNIKARANEDELDENVFLLWQNFLSKPTAIIRQIIYDNYVKNCNVIGATCSSIDKWNQNLSDLFSEGKRRRVNIPTRFYKHYCETFGEKISYTTKDGTRKEKYSEADLKFSTIIQDESSKATPAELSLPLIYGKKNIIIGDHRQLPPMLDKEDFQMSLDFLLDRTDKEEDRKKIQELKSFVLNHFDEMEISHFQRLYEKIDDSLKCVFNFQYRMHPDINEVIKQFYVEDGGLNCGLLTSPEWDVNSPNMRNWYSRYHGIELDNKWITKDTHTIWIDTDSPELLEATSRVNYGEVYAIRKLLKKLRKSKSFQDYQSFWTNPEDKEIGLISFYGKQIELLNELQKEFKDIPMRISTVDRFQGMERNIIIVSMVRSNRLATHPKQKPDKKLYPELGFPEQTSLGFAQSPNRLNVALSRAKRLLIIVGNSELFKQKEIYRNVYQTIANNPNGKIVKYSSFDYADKFETPTLNKSINLNTRDIDTDNDKHLREKETWLTVKKENPKIAVLELSTKAVKLLICDQEKLLNDGFSFDIFLRDAKKTETGNGLDSNNKMDMNYFSSRVLPAIQRRVEIIKQNNVDVVYCVSTAAYRTAANRDEIVNFIRKETGINVRILSKQEEAEATLSAYTFSTRNRENFIKAKNVVMIDQGGGSTEITLFQDQHLVKSHSFEIGTTALKNMFFQDNKMSVLDALDLIDKQSTTQIRKWLSAFDNSLYGKDTYCVCVGTAITKATPGKNSRGKHDKIVSKENIQNSISHFTQVLTSSGQPMFSLQKKISYDNEMEGVVASRLGLPVIVEIMDYFGIEQLSVSGTGLWYGIFFQELYKIKQL
jgi:superfamily I DNA and/or RNA helicase